MKDIKNKEDIEHFLDVFYERVRAHEVLGPIFNEAIGNLWFLHLDTLSRFWETLLFDTRSYYGAPFPKHLELPIKNVHFDMWLELFIQTVNDLFKGEKAEEAKHRAKLLAKTFRHKLAHSKKLRA